MQWSPSCGGHAHTLKFSPGKGGSRTSGFASPARVLKVKSPPRQGAWAGRVVARLVPRGCWSTGFSWGRKVLFPPFGVWRLRCSPLEMGKLQLRGSHSGGRGAGPPKLPWAERTRAPGRLKSSLAGNPLPQQRPERLARGWTEGAETRWAGLRRHLPRLPARSARLPSLRGRGGRGEPSATARAPRRARPAPGSMGPPLCAARPAPRRARSLPRGQVRALWVLRVGTPGGGQEGTGNSWVLKKQGAATPVCRGLGYQDACILRLGEGVHGCLGPGEIGGWVPGHQGLGHLGTWLERLGGGLAPGGGVGEGILNA